jgi:hypothetical protein
MGDHYEFVGFHQRRTASLRKKRVHGFYSLWYCCNLVMSAAAVAFDALACISVLQALLRIGPCNALPPPPTLCCLCLCSVCLCCCFYCYCSLLLPLTGKVNVLKSTGLTVRLLNQLINQKVRLNRNVENKCLTRPKRNLRNQVSIAASGCERPLLNGLSPSP